MPLYKRSKTAPKEWRQESSERVVKHRGVYIGYVKDNRDVQNMGRLRVYVPDLGGDPHDKKSWFICSYATPFGGQTPVKFIDEDLREYEDAQSSYGFWAVPPDVDTQVLVCFANGDSTRAYWFGCVFDQYMNQMVPGIAASDRSRHYGPETTTDTCPLPTTEYNKINLSRGRGSIIPNDEKKPVHKFVAEGLKKQGLIFDDIRGITTSSARRESPSKVFGMSTPGPFDPEGKLDYPYKASRTGEYGPRLPVTRKGGHQFIMDDNEDHEHIRLRTRSGAQILISETKGMIYICNRDGSAWVELGEDGNVDIYGAKSMSIRSELDINIRADRDLNVEAGRDINMKAAKSYREATETQSAITDPGQGEGGDINIYAMADMETVVEDNIITSTVNGDYDLNVYGRGTTTFGTELGVKSLNYNLDTIGNVQFEGTLHANANITTLGDMSTALHSLNSLHNHVHAGVQSGGSVTAPSVTAPTSPTSATGPDAQQAVPMGIYIKSNVVLDIVEDGNKEFCLTYKREDIQTINGRFVTHEPCVEHGTGE